MENTAASAGPVECGVRPHDPRRWRVEEERLLLKNVPMAHFCDQNGFDLEARCRIGNLGVGHCIWIGDKGITRVA